MRTGAMDCLHLGRQRVPDRRARRHRARPGAVSGLRGRLRAGRPGARRRPCHRPAVRRHAGTLHANREPPRLALPPSGETLLDRMTAGSRSVVAIGKIQDLFAGRGITRAYPHGERRGRRQSVARADGGGRPRPGLRQPRRLRQRVRPPQRHHRLRAEYRAVRRPAGRAARAPAADRPADRHRRPRQRSDHAQHRPFPRIRAAADRRSQRPRRRRSRDASNVCRSRPDAGGAVRRRPTGARHQLSPRDPGVTDRPRRYSARRYRARPDHPRTARSSRARDAGAAGGQERRLTRASAAGARRRRPAGVSARSRSHHSLQGVPPPQAQDAGLFRADRRPLPDPPDAHPRGVADRANHRQGAASARGADRGDRARPRSRSHAVRARRRADYRQPDARRVQSLRAESAHRQPARKRRPWSEPDLGGARRHRQALEREVGCAGRHDRGAAREHDRGADHARRRSHRLRQSRH